MDDALSYGDMLSVIDSENVTATWTVGSDSIRTKHKVYTIGGSLTEDNDYHTLIDLGCKAAKGLHQYEKDAIFNRIWNKYQTKHILRIDDTSTPLQYWGDYCVERALRHRV
ncbi:MAG: hypothetical protein J5758_07295, partial [Abditibacteriota bacterium]|nr:hypothetical protein [Abditibacteriota bacterium]